MKVIAVLILLLSGSLAPAQSIYVAQNTQGQDTGLDALDTHSLAWLNTSTNWGSGTNKVGPGTTVHLVGTLTNTLTFPQQQGTLGSGTPGNPITIYFEPNAIFTAPTLPAYSQWINICSLSNIVIDGGVNGLIQLTDNGTVAANGGTMDYGNGNVCAIDAAPITNVTIKNLTVSNLYNRQTNTEFMQGGEDGCAVAWGGAGLTVSNCSFTGCQDMVFGGYSSPPGSNLTVVSCVFSNFNHGVTLGAGGGTNPLFYNVSITHNRIECGDMFETVIGQDLGLHRNPIFFFNQSTNFTGCISNIVIAYNKLSSGFKPYSYTAGTAAIYFNIYNNSMASNVMVYNNISTLVAPLCWSGGGGFIVGGGTQVLVANNTAVGWISNGVLNGVSGITGIGTNVYLYNNICCAEEGMDLATFADTNGLTLTTPTCVALLSGLWSDYNIYNYQGFNSFYELIYANGGAVFQRDLMNSFSQWTNIFSGALSAHFDPHSSTALVQMDANYIPLSTDTVAVGHGTNLTAWGITDDFAGNPRPATGNWTIGAYQITDGNTNSTNNMFNGVTASSIVSVASLPVAAGISISNFVPGGAGADITNGLLVWCKFNQSSGTTAIDSSGNNHVSELLTGNAAWTNGLAGTGALAFPNNDGIFSSPDGISSTFNPNYNGDWTATFWVNNYSFPGMVNVAFSTGVGSGLQVASDNQGQQSIWGFNDGTTLLSASNALATNRWYFIAVSKSAGTNYQLYLNGSTNSAGILANVNIPYLIVGNRSSSFGMNGCMEDFRLFGRVLAPSEVSILAANGPDDVAATLLAAPANLHVVASGP